VSLPTLALFPWAAVCAAAPRLRSDWLGRFGFQVPPIAPGAVWVHAASVGEIRAASALVAQLEGPVLLTADTDTGVDAARRVAMALGPRVQAAVRPADHRWTLAPLLSEARPRAVIFVEGTWWPGLARQARRLDVPVLRVSAKAGPNTRRVPRSVYRRLAKDTTAVFARDEAEAAWFRQQLDVPVLVTGDLKAAAVPVARNPLQWSRPFMVGASLRGDDAAVLIAAHPGPWLLAPRYPESFDPSVLDGRHWVRRSELAGRVPPDADVVLLDTMGELAGCLVGASVAFVGGTFDASIGGHSPWEAHHARVPVICGPHIWSQGNGFRDVAATVIDDPSELALVLRRPHRPPDQRRKDVGKTTADAVGSWLRSDASPPVSPRPWLAPVAPAVRGGVDAWHAAWDAGLRTPTVLDVPVVSVGSTNPRGSGKTPVASHIAGLLASRGHKVGIAVRGYRRRGSGLVCSWDDASSFGLGDEGALHARKYLVAACPDRVLASKALVSAGATVIVLDDGLQHRHLARDIDLLVLDAADTSARGMMPVGDRREVCERPARVTAVIALDGALPNALGARRVPGPWHMGDQKCTLPDGPLFALAGIARPARFFASLPARVAETRALRDHQPIDLSMARELLAWSRGRPILCTAKDRVRMPGILRDRVYWRDLRVIFDEPVPLSWLPGLP
jgi:3-deoxy-D-manno-octulosonic-acid transferase